MQNKKSDSSSKPKKLRKRAPNDEVLNRRMDLAKIIEQLQKDRKPITRDILITELKKKGYTVDRNILYHDRTYLNRGNSFIRDLTESNYSQMMQDIWEKLAWIEEQAIKNYEIKWTNSKLVKKQILDKVGYIHNLVDKHLTKEIAQPKAAFLSIVKDCQKLKYELMTGQNVHLSAALLQQKLQSLEQENYELQKKLEEAKALPAPNTN